LYAARVAGGKRNSRTPSRGSESPLFAIRAEGLASRRMDYLDKARRVIDLEIAEVQRLRGRLDESFVQAVDLIRQRIESGGKVVVVGVGKSGHIGEKIAATLTSTGSPAVVLNSLNALHGDLGVVADGDVVLALSYSGETDELINLLPALARFDVQIIAMTGKPASLLAKACHVHLDVGVEREACPLELAPTSSTTAMLVLGDALAMVLLEARGFTKEDFARFHPGGRLGRTLLLRVEQIMRDLGQMALTPPGTTVREALFAMARARAGAAVITGDGGVLLGIFTHGDFGRHFQIHADLLELPVGDFMTANPITIRGEKLAAEVLRIMEQHRIDDLVVVDAANCPIGVIDSQDLARVRLV
ncbi:MAG TPA: KpsF/GutQ family sugar-phosphate isomerase, partial [Chthoniobacteraceae bacterium]|nr:KpsF/GutQ family sugar-phosphate isomerase [Chthoniobacteraceae bacterium]